MKYIAAFMLGIGVWCWVGASFETDLTVHYIQQDRQVLRMQHPNTDGRTHQSVYEIYTDRIFKAVISNEVVCATNEVDTGLAVIKTENDDPRR